MCVELCVYSSIYQLPSYIFMRWLLSLNEHSAVLLFTSHLVETEPDWCCAKPGSPRSVDNSFRPKQALVCGTSQRPCPFPWQPQGTRTRSAELAALAGSKVTDVTFKRCPSHTKRCLIEHLPMQGRTNQCRGCVLTNLHVVVETTSQEKSPQDQVSYSSGKRISNVFPKDSNPLISQFLHMKKIHVNRSYRMRLKFFFNLYT